MVKKQIENLIKKSIKQEIDFTVEIPEQKTHGDYATNVALIKGRKSKENPIIIAKNIINKIKRDKTSNKLFEKIEVIKPGFINFFLKPEYLQRQVKEILSKKEKFGEISIKKNEKVQVEFISANPTGKLHLGNGRGAFTGDTLANILEKAGYKTQREYYVNNGKSSKQVQTLGQTALGKGNTYLNPYLKDKIKKLKPKLKKIKQEKEAGNLLAQEIIKDIKTFVEKKLKIKFDNWFSEENELYKNKKADKLFKLLKTKGLIYEKEGAQWLKTSKYGDDKDRVIIRKTKEPAYILSDLAYHYNKFKQRKFDKVINIWGADHYGYIDRIKAGIKMLGINPKKLDIIITQLVRLVKKDKKTKMSKREGKYITLEELIDRIGLDITRFFFLMHSAGRHMDFDLTLAEEKSEKNPVYYVQYAYARICSILKKDTRYKIQDTNLSLLTHPNEIELIKELIKLPEIIEETAKDYQVQRLPNYAINLASVFHNFYTNCRVLNKNKDLKKARLALTLATKIVLKNTLDLLGISAPEKM